MSIVTIEFGNDSSTKPMHGYLQTPTGDGKTPAIIVAHELFGVNPDICSIVDRLGDLGYVALAPEFYHRHSPAGEWLERNDAGRKRGFEYLNQTSREQVVQDVRAAMDYLRQRDDVNGKIGILGFSAGGHMAFLAAASLDLCAAAILYGGWLTGGEVEIAKPNPTINKAKDISARGGKLLYIVGDKDAIIDRSQIARIREALAAADPAFEVVVLPEAQHAFFWEGTPSFNVRARDEAWKRVTTFFKDALGQ